MQGPKYELRLSHRRSGTVRCLARRRQSAYAIQTSALAKFVVKVELCCRGLPDRPNLGARRLLNLELQLARHNHPSKQRTHSQPMYSCPPGTSETRQCDRSEPAQLRMKMKVR